MLPRLNVEIPQLQHLLKSGDPSGFENVYDQYSPALYGWILQKVPDIKSAEEVLCNSFRKVMQCIDQYNPEKCGFFTWLIQVSNKEIQLFNSSTAKVLDLNRPADEPAQISIQTGA